MRTAVAAGLCFCLAAAPARAGMALIGADRDNTLYEIADGSISNGMGQHLFAGMTAQGFRRRAVIRFDVASALPAGAVVVSAQLTLHMSRTTAAAETVFLNRLTADWGEGNSVGAGQEGNGAPSQPGDATWIHTFYPGLGWASPGGDFVAAPSAARSVIGGGFYSWTSIGMSTDVQAWLDSPATNFGWAVIGDESAPQTAKRFDSRENLQPTFRPVLEVQYVPSPGALTIPLILGGARRRRAGTASKISLALTRALG